MLCVGAEMVPFGISNHFKLAPESNLVISVRFNFCCISSDALSFFRDWQFFFLRQGLSLGSNLQTVKSEGSACLSPQYCDYKLTTTPCFFHGYCVPNSGPQAYAANPILTEPSAQLLVNVFFTNLIHENSFFLRIFLFPDFCL